MSPLYHCRRIGCIAFFPPLSYSMATHFHPFNSNYMSQKSLIQLKNKTTGETYWTRKNKKLVERKIEYKKYSAKLRKHVVFKEAKK
jgi:large subunit ribosomal protein L33